MQYQTKMSKYKNRTIFKTINSINPKFEEKAGPPLTLRGWATIT